MKEADSLLKSPESKLGACTLTLATDACEGFLNNKMEINKLFKPLFVAISYGSNKRLTYSPCTCAFWDSIELSQFLPC
jgi:hypothetical protein